jgi:hypothetical protein
MSAIADLVVFLTSSGISAEFHGKLIDLVVRHGIEQVEILRNSTEFHGKSAETSYERRLRKDRDRKRNSAETKKPPLILTSLLPSEEILPNQEKKEISKKERRAREKKRLGPLPENWQPPDIAFPLAADSGTTVPIVEAIFRDYLKSSGKLYADHDAAFCNFVRNQRKFNGTSQGKPANGRRTVHDAANDLIDKIRSFDEPAPSGLLGSEGEDVVRLLPARRRE